MLKKTQTFNDGLVKIYAVENIAENGAMPVEKLKIKQQLRYHERTVGYGRFWTALQNNVRVKYVLRCQRLREISTQDIAIPNDGKQYRIIQVQYPEDITPPVMDLTLEKLEQEFVEVDDELE